jgi:hypothetical protein
LCILQIFPGIEELQIKYYNNLQSLNASYNLNITDAGINNMQLHTLKASHNPNITDAGIKHMQLQYYAH